MAFCLHFFSSIVSTISIIPNLSLNLVSNWSWTGVITATTTVAANTVTVATITMVEVAAILVVVTIVAGVAIARSIRVN